MNEKSPKTDKVSTIVCHTDFSDHATEAATVAAIMAKKIHAPLKLVYARNLMGMGSMPEFAATLDRFHRERLNAECARLEKLGADVEGFLCEGRSPSDSILQVVDENNACMLIVPWEGSHGDWHMDTISERLAQLSPVPTIVIQKAAPFKLWLENKRPLEIFVGVDFSLSSDQALQWVKTLQSIAPCQVTAAYADHPAIEERRLGISGSFIHTRNTPQVQEILERDLREKVRGILGNDDAVIVVEGGWNKESSELLKAAKVNSSDLIVVDTYQRHGLKKFMNGSVSRKILHYACSSVACVPVGESAERSPGKIQRFKRVIAAVDLEEPHGFAAKYAYSIVEPGGQVLLFHNVVPCEPYAYNFEFLIKEVPDVNQSAIEKRLLQLAPEDAGEHGIKSRTEISEERNTADAICHAAEQLNADAICLGSHTRPGFTAKILGSVALSVLQKSRRPVLLTWPPKKYDAR